MNGFTNKEKQQASLDKLADIEKKVNAVSKRLDGFKKDTAERKANHVVEEISKQIKETEAKVQ